MKRKITIEIHAEWPTPFQKQLAESSFEAMIKSWRSYIERAHKKNRIIMIGPMIKEDEDL